MDADTLSEIGVGVGYLEEWGISGPLAQRLEQRTHNPSVPGSNPGGPTRLLGNQITRSELDCEPSGEFCIRFWRPGHDELNLDYFVGLKGGRLNGKAVR